MKHESCCGEFVAEALKYTYGDDPIWFMHICVFAIPQLEPRLIRKATLVIVNGAHGNGHLREEKSEIKMAIE